MTSFRLALLVLAVNILVWSVPVFANIGDPCTSNNECWSLEYCDIPFGEEDGLCASTCGNGICLAPWEDHDNCPADCPAPTCPNNVCNSWENQFTCPGDCPDMCWENTPWEWICNYGENSTNCPEDCFCGNGTCEFGESYQWPSSYCAADCPPAPPSPPCDNPPDWICDSDESCSCSDCAGESRCQRNPPPPPPTCPLGQIWASWLNACIQVACDLGPATCTQLNNAMCTYNNVPMDFFVVVDTSSSMAPWRRQWLADTVAKSLRVAAENTPWSTITFFSFDDFWYRWEWSDGMPSAPNLNWWVRYKFPWNTEYWMIDYWSNPANRPIVPPFFEYGFFEEAWSQTNMIEWFNALTHVIQQFPVNPTRKKIVYWLSDGEPTIWSANPLCSTGEQPCQTSAAETRADQFRAAYPNIDVVAVWLDTESYEANILLQNHVASDPSLFNNASSNTIYGLISEFCDAIPTPNHPLNNFTDLYCDEACAPNNWLCWPINGTSGYNATVLTPSTPWMCAPWEVQQLVSTSGTWGVTFTWICASTNGGTGSNQCTATKEYCGDAAINWPEICDTNWNIWCTNDKICQQCWSCVTQWGCGYLDGESIYDFDNAWDALTWTSLWLCVWWYSSSGEWINYITTWFTYDERNHIWTWSCIPENQLDAWKLWWVLLSDRIRTSCTTTEMWCGDWTIQNTWTITYEQLNEQLLKELDTISEVIWLNATWLVLPWGKPRVIGEVWVMQTDFWTLKSHQNRLNSLQTPTEQCETHLDCAQWQNCFWCQCKTVWACHPDLQYFYAAQETPTFFENWSALCAYGQTSNIVYDYNTNKRTYQCVWDPWTPTASCEIRHLFCGDNVVNNINSGYPEDYEECEPWIGVWCTLQCTAETYACQWPLPTNAILCLNDDQSLTWNTTNSLVASCTWPQKCEYVCDAWYDFDGTHCTQTVACNSKPFNTTWHSGDGSYAQFLSGTTRTPTYSTTHSITNNVNACEFYCNANYTWNGTSCAINMFTVVFSWNGWTWHTPTSKLVTWNTILGTLPSDPIYSGYAFNGWWNQIVWWNTVTSTTVITWDRTVYAQWTQLPVTGVCGNANNVTYPYSITQYSPDMQCAIWTPTTTAFPVPGGTVSWTCSWLNGWPSSSQCSSSRANTPINWACWTADGFVYALTWSTYAPLTQCESWSPTNTTFPAPGDSTTRTCNWVYGWLPSTTCSASRQSWSCDLTNTYASWSVPGRRCPAWWTLAWWPGCYMCKRDELGIARCLMPECWNGVLDSWEVCDDANINNNDSCTNDCQRPFCGDGIFTPSATWTISGTLVSLIEMCDPVMTWSEQCPWNCLLTGTLNSSCNVLFQAKLWYNVTEFDDLNQPNSLCFPFGMASWWNHTIDTWKWSCPWINWWLSAFWCELPKRRCGDNVLDSWIINEATGLPAETCDDGNLTWWDGCSATCSIEPVINLASTSGLCTIQSYPQIEVGEYLPIRWAGISSTHMITEQNCAEIPWNPSVNHNGIQRDTIMWDIAVLRGWEGWLESAWTLNDVKIAQYNTTSTWMITDAIKDFGAEWINLIWTKLVEPNQIEAWVNTWATPKYGQYLLRLPQINYSYCAWSRDWGGTATGQTNVLSETENCSNSFDDNGNGRLACADTLYCSTADNCIVWTWGWGWWTYSQQEESCTDGQNTPGSHPWIDCADPDCNSAPNCLSSVRPEHCANGIDDNNKDWIDCADPTCYTNVPYCKWTWTENCSNTYDDNQNGLIDCNDPQCMNTVLWCSNMSTAWICNDNFNNEPVPWQTNWQDNDYISSIPLFDYSDPQCFLSGFNNAPPRIFPEYNCYDNLPAWWDPTLNNCADPTCQLLAVCGTPLNAPYAPWPNTPRSINPPAEVCNDSIDNDGDGRNNCSDYDCKTSTECGYIVWGWWSQGETVCADGEDDDGDWRIDCVDGECATNPACNVGMNEDCLNGTDDDGDIVSDSEDPDCVRWYQFEEWFELERQPTPQVKDYTYTWSNGYVCEAGFSVSKWYFVQQWFAFTEEANAWLESSDFVSIWWVPLVTEWTVLDDGENNVASYSQQWAKAYLFSGFIDTRELKATNRISLGWDINNNWLVFKKVPNAQIYFWQWETASWWKEVLELNEYYRDLLLNRGWVPDGEQSTTPYTIVLPWSANAWVKQVLDIQWSLSGNALYVSQGDIRFSSSQWSCDFSDSVEWLFIAAGEFTTTPINNKNPNATRRCKWWNLKIRGTLLWSNAWSSLAPLRRSVIDARNPNATFFDNSLVFQAKELFETCYLPALAMKKWQLVMWNSFYPWTFNGPIAGCNFDALNTAATRTSTIEYSKIKRDGFLWTFTAPGNILATALTCTDTLPTSVCQKSIAFVYEMMDSVQNANSLFVIPWILQKNWNLIVEITLAIAESYINQPQTLLWKMKATNKRFPARWFEWVTTMPNTPPYRVSEPINFTDEDKPKMMNDVSKVFGEIKDAMVGFAPITTVANNTNNIVLNTTSILSQKLAWIFWNTEYSNTFPIALSNCPYFYQGTPNLSSLNNKIACHPDYKWLRANKTSAGTQWSTLASNIVDGSSVVISSQPKLWTDLPPGAKDFLNNIVVVPR